MKTAGLAGVASVSADAGSARAAVSTEPPIGFRAQRKFRTAWSMPLGEIVQVDFKKAAPEIADPNLTMNVREGVKERHRIYSYLLMKLIQRFWNGNKLGPLGYYPDRKNQMLPGQPDSAVVFRYRGDDTRTDDPLRVNWDRYLGHNIACLAVDASGEIIDFEFNHNDLFRSSAEHAESRMVRRLFTITQDFDTWKTAINSRAPNRTKSSRISLDHVTLYTSLESCAQCSGVMSLANIKRVIYLQNDFGQYQIGNIMFNLDDGDTSPVPIPASGIDLEEFEKLNQENLNFDSKLARAKAASDISGAFYVPPTADGKELNPSGAVFSQSITSFLCTDTAYRIFVEGAAKLDKGLRYPDATFPGFSNSLSNKECLEEAKRFFAYADMEGFRGSPHRP